MFHVKHRLRPTPRSSARSSHRPGCPSLEEYAALLASEGVLRGLIGPREVPRLWDRHLVNCGLLAPLIPEGARVADLGSGAGLPGLVLALARPDLEVTLIEPMARRVDVPHRGVHGAGCGPGERGARPCRGVGRAGDGFDVVTSRALAPLPRLLTWSLPLVAPGGVVLAMKGSSAATEIEQAGAELGAVARGGLGGGVRGPRVVTDHGGPGGPGSGPDDRLADERIDSSQAKGTQVNQDPAVTTAPHPDGRAEDGLGWPVTDGRWIAFRRFPPVWGGPLSVRVHRKALVIHNL